MFYLTRQRSRGLVVATALVLASTRALAQGPATPPEVLTHVDAVYPADAGQAHADVVLFVTVDKEGRVDSVEVVQSGGKTLDEAAVVAMRQWRFRPAMRGGAPIAARIKVPFHFSPPSSPPDEVPEAPGHPPTVPGGVARRDPAPEPGKPGPPPPSAPLTMGEVTIVGRLTPPSRGASDFQLHLGELSRVPRQNATEILKLAPGILLTNEGGEGHPEQVFLRGFDAREGQDIEFSVGGVPINESGNLHGNGYADTHFILPELVRSIRVIEGPFDPRQGNYAVAGSADYELGLERRGLTVKYMGGSFGTSRAVLLWGPEGQSERTFGAAEIYSTDGFGPNRDARRGTASGQYEGKLGDRGTYRVTGMAYATSFHSAGVLRDDDYRGGRARFFDTYDTRQGGDSSRYSISGELETRTDDSAYRLQVFLVQRDMRLRENFTGFLDDPQTPLQSPHGQRGDLLDLSVRETTIGTRGFARTHGTLLGQTQEIELGYFARGDRVEGSQYRVESATGHPYRRQTDLTSSLGDLGLYVDGSLRISPYLTFRGGARADLFTFDVLDNCAVASVAHPSKENPPGDASCLSQQDFGKYREPIQRSSTAATALMPRASVLVGPWDGFTASASYGRGARSIDPSYVTDGAKTPFAEIVAYEGGVAYAGGTPDLELVARSIFFQTHVDRDLVFSETAGRNLLGGGTTRTGWVGAARATGAFFDEAANVTLVRSTLDDTHLLVPYAPDVVVRSDTAFFGALPFALAGKPFKGTVSSGVTYVGHRALPFGQRSDTIFTIDAGATLAWTRYELGFIASNLLDRRYRLGEYNFASDFHTQPGATLVPVRHFTAGAPRGLFATFAVTFGGDS